MSFKSVIKDKTFVLNECNASVINVYVGDSSSDNVPMSIIKLDFDITNEKDFHREISYWTFEN